MADLGYASLGLACTVRVTTTTAGDATVASIHRVFNPGSPSWRSRLRLYL